ncbi:hypothetical protein [Nocardia cyriacigeorgica]|uniref:hypothetical protein n=1 Tax=Nocardia cyriacigeorgica TaxID=135487 RepID=UPI00245589D3|nr:hypothetical protein [Nocardia cyriacigeorgica]
MSDTTIRDQLAAVLHNEGIYCGDCDYESGECSECDRMLASVADAILAAGFRAPAPVERFRLSNLDALPIGALIVADATPALKTDEHEPGVTDGDGYRSEWATTAGTVGTYALELPATILHVPTEEADRG